MTLVLHYHPLASFCWKVLIALYENDIAFTRQHVDLGDAESRRRFAGLWPIAKMPVLEDRGRHETVAETSIILEYLDRHYPGPLTLIPADPNLALAVRMADRFYDNYLQAPMQKIVGDRIRPAENKDPFGVEEARGLLRTACAMVDSDSAGREWAAGDAFSMADCAAAPALFYVNEVMPLRDGFPSAFAFLERLKQRPSVARVIEEAEPFFQYFPKA